MHTNEYRHPAAAELAAKLHQQNPTWSPLKCCEVAKRQTTAPSALRLGASGHPGAETRECQGAGRMVNAMEVRTSDWLVAGGEK